VEASSSSFQRPDALCTAIIDSVEEMEPSTDKQRHLIYPNKKRERAGAKGTIEKQSTSQKKGHARAN